MKVSFKIKQQIAQTLGNYDFCCIGCRRDIFDGLYLCKDCLKLLSYNNGKTCDNCGTAIYGISNYCSKCGKRECYFKRAYSPLIFEGEVQRLMHSFKFGGRSSYALPFAKLLADYFACLNLDIDLVTSVPMHEIDKKERGYNQSYLLASSFCDILGLKYVQTLEKIKQTQPQEKLNYVERMRNLNNAFQLIDKNIIKDKNILLIDDVLTTGATANECSRIFSKANATTYVLTLASRKETIKTE
ncbi:MAG: ComF family protein [Clostridia bacterium]